MTFGDGVVIEASILARLLGMKLLRLTAHVTLQPADFERLRYVEPEVVEGSTQIGHAAPFQMLTAPQPANPGQPGTLSDAASLLAHASRTIHGTSQDER